ncbi:RNA-binding suppressor of PAS kinase protein 1 [Nakaseomyces bracarensis]|uniref:RNA-binding suppressor of PAS kinase protein 1 n=1 Tax=Nakaseomyces bracarensis TaxID=273131 RepID=A0ABR4NPX3_9SACH
MKSSVDYEELGLTPAMLTALFKRPHDRQFVIDMEASVLNFVDSKQNSLELRPMNSYYRLLSHQIAEYHHLRHVIARNNESCVILFKVEETQKLKGTKPMLKDLEPVFVNEPSSPDSQDAIADNEAPSLEQENPVVASAKKFKILKREKSKDDDTIVNESSSQENLTLSSDTRETSLLESNNSSSSVLLEEERLKKEEHYNQIRQNLFESQKSDENEANNEPDDMTNIDELFPNNKIDKIADSKEYSAPYYRVKIVQDKLDTFNELKNGDSPQPDDFQTSRHSFMSNQEYQSHQKGYQNRNVRRSFHSSSNSSISNMSNESSNNYKHKSRSGSFTKRGGFHSRRSSYNNTDHNSSHYNTYAPPVQHNPAAGFSIPYMIYPPQQQVPFQPMPYPGMYPPTVPIPMDTPGSIYNGSNPYMFGAPYTPGIDGIGGPSGAAAGGMAPNMSPYSPNMSNGGMPIPPMMGTGVPRYGMAPYGYRYPYNKNVSGDSRGYSRKYSKNFHKSKPPQVTEEQNHANSSKDKPDSDSDNDRQKKGYDLSQGRSQSNTASSFKVTEKSNQKSLSDDMDALSI